MKKLFVFLIIFIHFYGFSQNSNVNDIDYLVNKIKTVYPGFNFKAKSNEFAKLVNEVKLSKDKDTFALLSRITTFFNDCHLSIFQVNPLKNIDLNNCKLNLIKIPSIKKPIFNNNDIQGFWFNELKTTVIYIKKVSKNKFEGYVLDSKKKFIKGACVLKLSYEAKSIIADFIDLDEGVRIFTKANFRSSKLLNLGAYSKWRKLINFDTTLIKKSIEFDYSPSLEILDSSNILFKMSDFSGNYVKLYDSLIEKNKSIISNTKNLILDIRNNVGGTTKCYKNLVSYICTNSILTSETYKLCSTDLIESARKTRDKYVKSNDSLKIITSNIYLSKLLASRDSLLYFPADTIECTLADNKIKNVAIIMNNCSRSAAELMVLNFKQSKKVKLFGEPSGGAVDYLDILNFQLPVSKYYLWIGSSKRVPTKFAPLYDEKGIEPDVRISDNELDWVDYVKKYYADK